MSTPPAAGSGALIGYARVSTAGQNVARQIAALTEAGCVKIFSDTATGKHATRPELSACMDYLRPRDTLVVTSLDRLSRSLKHLVITIEGLDERGVGFRSLHESIDTTTPAGRLQFHVFGALAEFVREVIVQGTRDGLATARAVGRRGGRPSVMNAEKIAAAQQMLDDGNQVATVARVLGVSRATIYAHCDPHERNTST